MDIITFSMHMSYFCRNRGALVSAGDAVVGFSVVARFCCTVFVFLQLLHTCSSCSPVLLSVIAPRARFTVYCTTGLT